MTTLAQDIPLAETISILERYFRVEASLCGEDSSSKTNKFSTSPSFSESTSYSSSYDHEEVGREGPFPDIKKNKELRKKQASIEEMVEFLRQANSRSKPSRSKKEVKVGSLLLFNEGSKSDDASGTSRRRRVTPLKPKKHFKSQLSLRSRAKNSNNQTPSMDLPLNEGSSISIGNSASFESHLNEFRSTYLRLNQGQQVAVVGSNSVAIQPMGSTGAGGSGKKIVSGVKPIAYRTTSFYPRLITSAPNNTGQTQGQSSQMGITGGSSASDNFGNAIRDDLVVLSRNGSQTIRLQQAAQTQKTNGVPNNSSGPGGSTERRGSTTFQRGVSGDGGVDIRRRLPPFSPTFPLRRSNTTPEDTSGPGPAVGSSSSFINRPESGYRCIGLLGLVIQQHHQTTGGEGAGGGEGAVSLGQTGLEGTAESSPLLLKGNLMEMAEGVPPRSQRNTSEGDSKNSGSVNTPIAAEIVSTTRYPFKRQVPISKPVKKNSDGGEGKSCCMYPDPLLNAPNSFLQRLQEISTIETETVRAERTKELKKKIRMSKSDYAY